MTTYGSGSEMRGCPQCGAKTSIKAQKCPVCGRAFGPAGYVPSPGGASLPPSPTDFPGRAPVSSSPLSSAPDSYSSSARRSGPGTRNPLSTVPTLDTPPPRSSAQPQSVMVLTLVGVAVAVVVLLGLVGMSLSSPHRQLSESTSATPLPSATRARVASLAPPAPAAPIPPPAAAAPMALPPTPPPAPQNTTEEQTVGQYLAWLKDFNVERNRFIDHSNAELDEILRRASVERQNGEILRQSVHSQAPPPPMPGFENRDPGLSQYSTKFSQITMQYTNAVNTIDAVVPPPACQEVHDTYREYLHQDLDYVRVQGSDLSSLEFGDGMPAAGHYFGKEMRREKAHSILERCADAMMRLRRRFPNLADELFELDDLLAIRRVPAGR